jgi:hypothetical protein
MPKRQVETDDGPCDIRCCAQGFGSACGGEPMASALSLAVVVVPVFVGRTDLREPLSALAEVTRIFFADFSSLAFLSTASCSPETSSFLPLATSDSPRAEADFFE